MLFLHVCKSTTSQQSDGLLLVVAAAPFELPSPPLSLLLLQVELEEARLRGLRRGVVLVQGETVMVMTVCVAVVMRFCCAREQQEKKQRKEGDVRILLDVT